MEAAGKKEKAETRGADEAVQANARCGTTGINTLRGALGAITALALRNNTNVTAAPGRRGGIGPVCSACRRGGYLLALVAPGAANSHFLHRPLGGTTGINTLRGAPGAITALALRRSSLFDASPATIA